VARTGPRPAVIVCHGAVYTIIWDTIPRGDICIYGTQHAPLSLAMHPADAPKSHYFC
jgi:hypothetical protein